MKFFKYKFDGKDDMTNHLSKLENTWSNLNLEIANGNNTVSSVDIF